MKRQDVLLLGGTGFIGSAIAKRLRQDAITVHVLGRRDGERLEQVLWQCSTVFHLASTTTPASSAVNPALESLNLALTERLVGFLREQPQTHLIFFSSGGTVYGDPTQLPVVEDASIAPMSTYGAGKVAQENILLNIRSLGYPITIFRPSNVYGPGQSMREGFGVVRTLLEHVRRGTTFEIWGDGENIRDFIYIDDVVEASVRLLGLPEDSRTYNVGSGVGYSINQVKDIVEAVCGAELRAIYRPSRGIDVRRVVLNSSRLNTQLKWEPCVELKEGIARTWAWVQQS